MKFRAYVWLLLLGCLAALTLGCGNGSEGEAITASVPSGPVVAPAAVYTLTNDATTNAVREFRRNTSGSLSFVADYPTGGSGSGDGLNGSSSALFFDAAGNRFYAVNAGSNSLTAMALGLDGTLSVLSTANSGGVRPISVTAFGDLVYVLNAGDTDSNAPANISGFRLNGNQLQAIPNSTQPLSAANPNPAQIAFTPSGTVLVVTERDTNNVTTFVVDGNGLAGAAQPQASNGNTPFGFDFTSAGVLVVSEAQAGADGASTTSSYNVGANGSLVTISNSVANGQTAACWVAIAPNLPYAYVTNTASDNVSIYEIDAAGVLTLQGDGNNAATGDAPVDLAVSNDSQFLYVLNTGDDSISAFGIGAGGALTPITGVGGLPADSVGLVAR